VSDVALLDVNLLVALFDPNHVHHDLAHDWFGDQRASGWATCPPASADRRISSSAFVNFVRAGSICSGRTRCRSATSGFSTRRSSAATAISDIYLLGLAKKHGGRLVTFDRGIPLGAVVGATRNTLSVISAAEAEE
jgi:predicted nucleic acid-binding protein